MLTPGRGLRGAALSDMARQSGSGAWAVAAKLGEVDIGTGHPAASARAAAGPDQRRCRHRSIRSAIGWAILWLTPAMDRLFTGSAGERRRFLDRLVLALEPAHAHHASRYEAAMRARNKLLAGELWDDAWLASLELAMADHGSALAAARMRTVAALDERLAAAPDDEFAARRNRAGGLGRRRPGHDTGCRPAARCRGRARDRGAAPPRPRRRSSRQANAGRAMLDRRAKGAPARTGPRPFRTRRRAARRTADPAPR